jgi:hypothetical protein
VSDTKVWVGGYRTGHCIAGNHFGTKNLSPGGALLPSCNSGGTCKCRCHPEVQDEEMLAFIASTLGDEAVAALPTAPALNGPTVPITLPEAVPVLVMPADADVPTAPGLPPNHADDIPEQLESGRRARGSLDFEVKTACDKYLTVYGTGTNGLTPQVCAKMIDADSPPSSGAVDAVWRRWVSLGFAVMGSKPVHFAGYTAEGVEKGLHRMKYEAKRRKRKWRR